MARVLRIMAVLLRMAPQPFNTPPLQAQLKPVRKGQGLFPIGTVGRTLLGWASEPLGSCECAVSDLWCSEPGGVVIVPRPPP